MGLDDDTDDLRRSESNLYYTLNLFTVTQSDDPDL